jgi:HAD superfamily hydrolase (TIGR01509 family)
MPRSEPAAPFDAILFDLDGTLADSAEDIRAALALAFQDLGVRVEASLATLVDGSPLEEIFAVALPGGTPAQLERFVAAYRAHYERGCARCTRLYPGVRETLQALRALRPPLRLGVATTKRELAALTLLEALEITDCFDVIAGSGGTTMPPKPAPDLLLAVARRLGVAPERTLMVGDTLRDVLAGQRAGMRTAAVTYGLGAADSLSAARPDYLIEEFEEVLLVLGAPA